jgi:hypothetical protein
MHGAITPHARAHREPPEPRKIPSTKDFCRRIPRSWRAKKSNTFFGIRINGPASEYCATLRAQCAPIERIATEYVNFDFAPGLVKEASHEITQLAADIV